MTRILSGGGRNAGGKPNSQTVGRPGFGSVARGFRQSVRRLSKSDPADGILNTPMSDVPKVDGVMRDALPRGLTAAPANPTISGREEQTITKPGIQLTAPVRRGAGVGLNRRLRKG